MSFEYNGVVYRDLEPQVRYDAEQVQLLKQEDVTINENLQTINTELDGKLNKPANPSAESAVTMSADGTVGTKLLSEIGGGGGGGKLYLHTYSFTINEVPGATISTSFYKSDNIEVSELPKEHKYLCTMMGEFSGVVSLYVTSSPISPLVYVIYGVVTNGTMITHYDSTEVTIERTLGDVVIEV